MEPLASLGGARFARRSLASLGWRPLKTVPPRAACRTGACRTGACLTGACLTSVTHAPERRTGATHRSCSPELLTGATHGPPLKVLWTSGVVPPEGKLRTQLGTRNSKLGTPNSGTPNSELRTPNSGTQLRNSWSGVENCGGENSKLVIFLLVEPHQKSREL